MEKLVKNWYIYLINLILIFVCLFDFLPNLSSNKEDYQCEKDVLKSTRIETKTYQKLFRKKEEHFLILVMEGGEKWELNDTYVEYWHQLQDTNNIGKLHSLYYASYGAKYNNPVQIEVDNKVIYTPSVGLQIKYELIFITIVLTIYNVLEYKDKISL